MTETATATLPSDASATPEATATLLATAGTETVIEQQQPVVEDPAGKPAEEPVAKPAEEGGDKPADEAKKQAEGAPEKYEFKAPDGQEYNPDVLADFSAAAKAANLTQEAAQKLIETMAPAIAARQADQVKAIQQGWYDASVADKEFGGDKLKENLAVAKKALDLFDPLPASVDGKPSTTPLRKFLDESGLEKHPEMIRLLFHAGQAISEDKFVGGKTGNRTGKRSITDVLYEEPTKGQ